MLQRTSSAGVVLYESNKVLLVRHTKFAKLPTNFYGFPAGRIEEGEKPIIAAIRELEEETGLITHPEYLHKLPEKESRLKMKEDFEDFIFKPFLCVKYSGELRPSEKTIPVFVELNRLDELKLISNDIKEIAMKWHNTFTRIN